MPPAHLVLPPVWRLFDALDFIRADAITLVILQSAAQFLVACLLLSAAIMQ